MTETIVLQRQYPVVKQSQPRTMYPKAFYDFVVLSRADTSISEIDSVTTAVLFVQAPSIVSLAPDLLFFGRLDREHIS